MSDEEENGGGEEGAPAWMATFSDLATLLLTFFVLLLSFANMDVKNFKEAMGSVKMAMGVQFKVNGNVEGVTTNILELSPVESGKHINIDELVKQAAEEVKKYVEKEGLEHSVEVDASPRGVVLRARDRVLFSVGSDDIMTHGTPVLRLIKKLFVRFDGELSIQGHTDSTPIASSRFPSNWELSTGRATAVMRYLTGELGVDRHRVQVAGYADTRPLVKENSEDARDKNRRVEFVFQFRVEGGKLEVKDAFHDLTAP